MRPAPPAVPGVSAPLSQPKPMTWKQVLTVAEPLSIAVLYIYLLVHSWLRWMDPMVDFPRDLYLAWRVSEGDLLYQKVANWYGPLAQLVQGSAFQVFGVGIDTIIWSNIALTAVVIILLRDLFLTLGNRWSGWLAVVVFLGTFAFGHYMANANYNFIAPYAAQSTYSFAGLVVVLWSLVHHLKSERPRWLGIRTSPYPPVVWLASPEEPAVAQMTEAGLCVRPAANGRGAVLCHPRFPADVAVVREMLEKMDGMVDPVEPFARIREAMGEARKMGVTKAA